MDLLLEDLLDGIDIINKKTSKDKLVDEIDNEFKPTVRLVFSYSVYQGDVKRLSEKDALTIFDAFKHIVDVNLDFIESYELKCQFNLAQRNDPEEINYNFTNPDEDEYTDYLEQMHQDAESSQKSCSLRHWVDFVPKEVSFKRFCRQINYLTRALGPILPKSNIMERCMLGIMRLDKKSDFVYPFMSKRNNVVSQSQACDLYRKIYPDYTKDEITLDSKYDEKYSSRQNLSQHTHFQNFLLYLYQKPNMFPGFITQVRGEKIGTHKDDYYNIWLKVQADPNVNLPKESQIHTTDEVIELVKNNIMSQFGKSSQRTLSDTTPSEWKEVTVNFNVSVPEDFLENPDSTQFRYETETQPYVQKKLKLYIVLYVDTKKWILQETKVDKDGSINKNGEGITYTKIGEIRE